MKSSGVWSAAFLLVGLAWAAPVLASFAADDLFLPSVGRGAGAQGSQWYTTMWVHKPGSPPVNVEYSLLLRDQPNPSLPRMPGPTRCGIAALESKSPPGRWTHRGRMGQR
jgi:hypothetical protein